MQTQHIELTPAVLVGALDALDVPFLAGGAPDVQLAPIELLQGLAGAPEARLRSAIIPLMLRHPEFSTDARAADQALSDLARVTCECFYTAAVLLQRRYRDRLAQVFGAQTSLPDWFSAALGIALSADADAGLRALGERHAALMGLPLNWVGTYLHAAERLIRRREVEAKWQQQLHRRAA
jgi:hypothetical protein